MVWLVDQTKWLVLLAALVREGFSLIPWEIRAQKVIIIGLKGIKSSRCTNSCCFILVVASASIL